MNKIIKMNNKVNTYNSFYIYNNIKIFKYSVIY